MAYDLLKKKTTEKNFGLPTRVGELPLGATGYAPDKWWTKQQAEDKVAEFMKSGGLFGTKLGRADAEAKTLSFLRVNNVGLMAGTATLGSWILNEKDQKRILQEGGRRALRPAASEPARGHRGRAPGRRPRAPRRGQHLQDVVGRPDEKVRTTAR